MYLFLVACQRAILSSAGNQQGHFEILGLDHVCLPKAEDKEEIWRG